MKNKSGKLERSGLHDPSPLRALFGAAYWKIAAAVIVIELVGAVVLAVSPLAQRSLIDAVNSLNRTDALFNAIIVAALLGIALLCQTGSYLLRFRLSVEGRLALKSALFHALLGVPESFLKQRGSGYFFNRLQADSTEVVNFWAGNALLQFSGLLKFLLALTITACLEWKCALAMLPLLALQYGIFLKYRRKQYRLGHRIQECTASERYRMQEYLAGHTLLKTHNAAEQAAEQLDEGFARWRTLIFQRLFHESRFRGLLMVPYYLALGGVAVYGLHLVLLQALSLGKLWAILLLVRQTFNPVQKLAGARFQMLPVQAAWERLRQITQAATPKEAERTEQISLQGDIVFSHVRFDYAAERPLFRDLSFAVKARELFFLTGQNGSGKTTVFHLLLRLYEPHSGAIQIGGRDVRSLPLASYRSRIGYLGQNPEFFPGTIRENLLLNDRHSDEEIMETLALLKSDAMVLKRGGLDAVVTEQGGNFSGGERLRLALARELLRDTDILLLDEAAANLDFEAKKNFYDLLTQLHGRKTILAIIHDTPGLSEKYSSLCLEAPPAAE